METAANVFTGVSISGQKAQGVDYLHESLQIDLLWFVLMIYC